MKLLCLVFPIALVGCQSSAPVAPPPVNPAASELTAKLKQMSPEERKAYLHQHPEVIQKAMGGIGGAPPKTQ